MSSKIPFNWPAPVGREQQHLKLATESGHLAANGQFSQRCSNFIEELVGSPCVLMTPSCTSALELAALLCELKPGDEVIMPSFTFVSTANAVVRTGATPVFVDIVPDTLNLDPEAVRRALTPATRAIFAVHYAGFPADMEQLAEIAQSNNLFLMEDAAQALGSTYQGRPCGSLGDIAAFSFHETKNVTCGEGGALVINRHEMIDRARILREKGTNRQQFLNGEVDKYTWIDRGSSYLLGELSAAFLYGQLERIEEITTLRQAIIGTYMSAFQELEQSGRLRLPRHREGSCGNGHLFYLLLRNGSDRDNFIAHMRRHNITTPFHYIPLHTSPAGKRFGRVSGTLPITENIADRLVRLPIYLSLGNDIQRVIDAAFQYLHRN